MADSKPPAVDSRAAAPSAGVAVAETGEVSDPLAAAELGPPRPPSRPTGMLHSLMRYDKPEAQRRQGPLTADTAVSRASDRRQNVLVSCHRAPLGESFSLFGDWIDFFLRECSRWRETETECVSVCLCVFSHLAPTMTGTSLLTPIASHPLHCLSLSFST